MSRGLSELQRAILEVLEQFPSVEESPVQEDGSCFIGSWTYPRDIMAALGRESTNANRVAVSKALDRLYERGLVERASGQMAGVGHAARYARVTRKAELL